MAIILAIIATIILIISLAQEAYSAVILSAFIFLLAYLEETKEYKFIRAASLTILGFTILSAIVFIIMIILG